MDLQQILYIVATVGIIVFVGAICYLVYTISQTLKIVRSVLYDAKGITTDVRRAKEGIVSNVAGFGSVAIGILSTLLHKRR